ncbi:hypothetical protein B0I35DRAFT_472203 [Stachybotrys elegans]|uniref:DUF7779 domain-containing protein n=1 Tax=Stachybotrys elegans TaxID=80388 RepID=A0A8K0SGZ5_9HYPO|nr:hypothetical protein B0I35DRAFT_472203 [Stachybotrys elegans]
MSESMRERPAVSQQFGNAVVSDGSRLFQGIVQGDLHLNLVIPFSRDRDFVERNVILDQVHNLCSQPGSRTALVGFGGVGKSQIAIEYAYRIRDQSPETWIFWVHASSAARYEQSFRDIADFLKLPGRRNPQNNIFRLLYNWLRGEASGKWVLILDNIDNASFLLQNPADRSDRQEYDSDDQTQSQPLFSYLPVCQHGSILLTTRSKEEALKLVERRDIIVPLVRALEYMPLAIVQATAYILQKAPRYSVQQYLEKFQQSDRKKATLLDYEGGQLRRDREAKNSIMITWQISFDRIRQIRPSAADLLSLMSFCDRHGIPESLLRASDEKEVGSEPGPQQQGPALDELDSDEESTDHESQSNSSDDDQFENDISALRDYSFISLSEDRETFEMHSLVQLATRRWLEAKGQQEKWKSEFICKLNAQLPTGEYENWEICRTLLPHTIAAAAQRPKDAVSLLEWAAILYKAAWYLKNIGRVTEAQILAEDAMRYRIKILGHTNEGSLNAMQILGSAEKLLIKVMEGRKTKLGVDHQDTLTSMANLALIYREQGRLEEAEKLQVQVTGTCKTKLGADHPSTLMSMANLTSTYRDQGRWEEAEKLDMQVIEIRKTKLGRDHPDTLTSMANLASTFWGQGQWKEAEKVFIQVMELSKTKLGADHPSTLTIKANLASTYREQGRWEEAENLGKQVMETRKTNMANLASIYRVVEIRKTKFGVDHPSTLKIMASLASTYRNQGRWEEAEKLQVQVMEISKTKVGSDHVDTLTHMNNLGEAERIFEQVMETRKTKLGTSHPDTLTSMANLASAFWKQGRWEEAEKLEYPTG